MKTDIISKRVDGITFTLGGTQLEKVSEYKYLGMTVDSLLTFQSYREILTNRVNLKVSYFRKIRKYLTLESALLVYKCTILPILEYADFVHDFNIKYINNKLQTIQNTSLYIVYNQHNLPFDLKSSTEAIHRRAGIHRLVHRRWLHMLLFIYNYVTDHNLLDVSDINTRRREGILFKIPVYDHYKCRQDPFVKAMNVWNELPVNTRNAVSKSKLRVLLKNSINNPYKKTE